MIGALREKEYMRDPTSGPLVIRDVQFDRDAWYLIDNCRKVVSFTDANLFTPRAQLQIEFSNFVNVKELDVLNPKKGNDRNNSNAG